MTYSQIPFINILYPIIFGYSIIYYCMTFVSIVVFKTVLLKIQEKFLFQHKENCLLYGFLFVFFYELVLNIAPIQVLITQVLGKSATLTTRINRR